MSPQHAEEESHETYWSHGWNKCKKQPLVPLGIVATCIALMGATGALRSGNRAQFNRYLRYRVAAQGVTVVAAVAGTLLLTNKADQLKESQRRTALGELPTSADDLIKHTMASVATEAPLTEKTTSDSALVAPSVQTTDPTGTATATAKGRFARPPRMSQALEETERLPGVQHAPVKVSDFARRLEQAEKLEGEVSGRK
ncbi:Respiratory supercomplex factor 1, mitochondrial [Naganishia albida]|nr:Respiratory supercomplex factor 1, mitochondrial [Naganishia albida]